jgi:hypothetical protein
MNIDWVVVATIAAPIIALFAGAALNRWIELRPILISYYGHVAVFQHNPQNAPPMQVHTHQVVVRNASRRRAATNVRLHHHVLPDYRIWPMVAHTVETLPDGSRDIVINALVPGEQVLISYLYFPPLFVDNVNAGIKCDQGFAQQIPVLLQRQQPRWILRLSGILLIAGAVSIIYVAYRAVAYLLG